MFSFKMTTSTALQLIFLFKLIGANVIRENYTRDCCNVTSVDNVTTVYKDNFNSMAYDVPIGFGNLSEEHINGTNYTFYETVVEQQASRLYIYFIPVLVIVGVCSNVMSIYVFFTSKLRSQSTSQYLSALAVSDSVFLGHLFPPWLSTIEINGLFQKSGFCKTFVYMSYVSCCTSSWLVVAFTVERFLAVKYPLRCPSLCTVKRARYIILAIVIGAMLVNLPVIKLAQSGNQECNIDPEMLELAARFNLIDTTVSFTVPLFLIIVLNAWIAKKVYKLKLKRLRLHIRLRRRRRRSLGEKIPRESESAQQRKITTMLLIVSSMFVCLNSPAYMLRLRGYSYDMEYDASANASWLLAQHVATVLFNMNFGINFFLYCMSGQNFRRALQQNVPCCGWIARKASALVNKATMRPARTCSLTTSTASFEATGFGTASERTHTRRRHEGSYIFRRTFDNSRQERFTATREDADSFELRDITPQPGPSWLYRDLRQRPGNVNVTRPGPRRPGLSCVVIDEQRKITRP